MTNPTKSLFSQGKYLYLTEYDLSVDNGPGINEREFVNVLCKRHSDKVICMAPYPKYPDRYFNRRIFYVASHNNWKKPSYLRFMIDVLFSIRNLYHQYGLKVIVTRLGRYPFLPALLTYSNQNSLLLKTLSQYEKFSHLKNTDHLIKSKIFLSLYHRIFRKVLLIDTVSENYVDWFNLKYNIDKQKIMLVPNGVNIDFFKCVDARHFRHKFGLDQFDFVFGYVGALTEMRHIEVLIRCCKNVSMENNVGLVIVGDGNKRHELQNLVRKIKLENRILFTGHLPYNKIPESMNAFDAAIDLTLLPMEVNGELYHASFSQKIPQYLACGLPVIAWDVPDNRYIEKNRIGVLARMTDQDALQQSMQRLIAMKSDERLSRMQNRAVTYAQNNFDIEKLTKIRLSGWHKVII